MTKQEYIQSRNANRIHLSLAYEMYINSEISNPKLPPHIFQELFQMWLGFSQSNCERYFKHYDEKFEVIKLVGLQGEIKYI